MTSEPERLRLAGPLAAFSLVTDLGMGSERMGVFEEDRRTVYDASILRFVGCLSTGHEAATAFGHLRHGAADCGLSGSVSCRCCPATLSSSNICTTQFPKRPQCRA